MGDFNPFNLPMGQGPQLSSGGFDPYSLPMAIHNATADTPPKGPPQWFGSGASMRYERASPMELRLSGAWRNEALRIAVGKALVGGSLMARPVKVVGHYWYFAWALCLGVAAAASPLTVNGTPIDEVEALVSPTEGVGWGVYLGDETQAVNSALASAFDWTSGWPWISYAWAKFNAARMYEVGFPTLVAEMSMKAWDFTAGTPGWVESESPILHLYTYLVKNPVGPRISADYIHASSWGDAHSSWCATLVSGAARWRAGGLLPTRDPMAAVGALLRSGWCSMPFVGGQFRLMPREDDASPVELDADSVRRSRVAIGQRPTVVEVMFPNSEQDFEEDIRSTVHPSLVTGGVPYVLRQDRPALLNAADVAARDARLLYESATEETSRYTLVVDPAVSPDVLDVIPGQVVLVSHSRWGATRQMRVERVKPGLYYRLTAFAHEPGKGFDIAGSVDGEVPGPVVNPAPDLPTSLVQTFVEQGNWNAHNLIPDEDDLETDWTENNVTAAFSSGGTIVAGSGVFGGLFYDFDPGNADTVLITSVVKSSDLDTLWNLGYDDGGAAPVKEIPIQTAEPATQTRRHVILASVSGAAPGPHQVYFENIPSGAGEEIKVMKTRVVGYAFRPGLALGERYEWVEHANAATTVSRYEVVRQFADGRTIVLASAPQGQTSLYAVTYSMGAIWGGVSSALLNGSQIRFRAVGRRGRMVYMEPTSVEFGSQISGDVTGDLRDFDETEIAAGKLVVVQADAKTKGYLSQGSGGGLDADTLDGVHLSGVSLASHNHDGSYLGLTAKAADSDKLDGLDGLEYGRPIPIPLLSTATQTYLGNIKGAGKKLHIRLFGGTNRNGGRELHDYVFGVVSDAGLDQLEWQWELHGKAVSSRYIRVKAYKEADDSNSFYIEALNWSSGWFQAWFSNMVGPAVTFWPGDGFSVRTPSGTLVFDSSDLTTYPPNVLTDTGGNMTLAGGLIADEVHIQQGYGLEMTDAGATKRTALQTFTSQLNVGDDFASVILRGTTRNVLGINNVPLQGVTAASTYVNLVKLNTSNDLEVGNAASGLRLLGDETCPKYNGGDLALKADIVLDAAARSLWSAKGTILAATAASTPAAVAVGANGYPLLANSALSAGVGYAQLSTTGIANRAVTAAKFLAVGGGNLLGRIYGSAAGDVEEVSGSNITRAGTSGQAGVSDATIRVAGSGFVGYYDLEFVNGWLTARTKTVTG